MGFPQRAWVEKTESHIIPFPGAVVSKEGHDNNSLVHDKTNSY